MSFDVKFPGFGMTLGMLRTLPERIRKAQHQAVLKEAHFLREKIIEGIDSGAPAGRAFAPLSPVTLAVRRFRGFGGSKTLVVSGSLRNSVVIIALAPGAVFVGVSRKAPAKGGKSAANIAQIHEEGRSWSQALTPKARRFLMAALRKAGLQRPPLPAGAKGKTVLTIRIPARPFIGPILEAHGKPEDVKARYTKNLADALGGDLGRP